MASHRLITLLLLLFFISGISIVGAQEGTLKVVATYSILGDIVQNIAGEKVELTVLVGPDGDSHVYEPSPQDAIALAEADLIFENGLEFETWLDELYEASGSTATRIVVSEGIEPLAFEEHEDEESHEDEHTHEDEAITDLSPWNGAWISTRRYSNLPEMQVVYETIAEIAGVSVEEAEAFIQRVERVDFDEMIVADGTVTYVDGDTRLSCSYQLMGEEEALFVGIALGTWYQWETNDPNCEAYRYVLATPLHSGDFGDVPNFHIRYGSMSFENLSHAPENASWFATLGPEALTETVYVESYTINAEAWAAFMLAERGDSTMLNALLADSEDDGDDHEHEEDEHGHDHGEFDPHVWHDPNNAVVMVENISAALVEADPANAAAYAANAESYIAELRSVDEYIREQVATIPEANRILVTSHDTFGYFADEYGFEVLNVLGSLSTEAGDPSAGEIAELIEQIQEIGVPAIFTENISNPELVEQVALEAGITIAPSLYTDALGQPGTAGETYLSLLRYNIDTITEALR